MGVLHGTSSCNIIVGEKKIHLTKMKLVFVFLILTKGYMTTSTNSSLFDVLSESQFQNKIVHLFAKKMQDLVTQMRTFKTEVKSEMKNVEACEKEEIGDVVTDLVALREKTAEEINEVEVKVDSNENS